MDDKFYQNQMNRLAETYGAQHYKRERVELLWREVKNLSNPWFAQVVDRFIGESKFAPLLPEFREEIARERERNHSLDKRQHSKDAKEFYLMADCPDQRGSMLKTILERMENKVSDDVWNQFTTGIEKLSRSGCVECNNSGLVFRTDDAGYEWTYRCYCPESFRQPTCYPKVTYEQRKVRA